MSDLTVSPPQAQIGLVWVLLSLLLSLLVCALAAANNVGVLVGASIRAKVTTPRAAKVLAAVCYATGALLFGPSLSSLVSLSVGDAVEKQARIIFLASCCSQLATLVVLSVYLWGIQLPLVTTQATVIGFWVVLVLLKVPIVAFYPLFMTCLWIASPVLSVGMTTLSRYTQCKVIWAADDPLTKLLNGLPYFFAITLGVYSLFAFIYGVFGFWVAEAVPYGIGLGVSFACSALLTITTYFACYYFGVPAIKKWVYAKFQATWQDYIPLDSDVKRAERASLEQRGIFVDQAKTDAESAASIKSQKRKPGGNSIDASSVNLSVIRAEEAFGYPQYFLLALLLVIDGGALYSVIAGVGYYAASASLIPTMPLLARWIWLLLHAAALAIGVLVLSRFTLDKRCSRLFSSLKASESLNMELGAFLPALSALVFGAPISLSQCKLAPLLVWRWQQPDDPNRITDDRVIMRNAFLFWPLSLLVAGGLSALIAYIASLLLL